MFINSPNHKVYNVSKDGDAQSANGGGTVKDHVTVKDIVTTCKHSYKDGVCTKCGAPDPDYTEVVPEETKEDCTKGHTYGADGKCTRCGAMNPVAVLESKYNTASAQLERNRSSAQQRAAVSLAKLQKYLPHQIKAQGLSGLGVSQTAALRMMNNYNAQMGEIDRDFNAGASDLLANYSDGRVALENAAAQDALAREQMELQKYQIDAQSKEKEEASAEAKAYSLYSDIINMIDVGYFKTSGDLTAYIDAHREDLGDYADRLDIIAKSSGEYIDEVAEEEMNAKAATEVKMTSVNLGSNDGVKDFRAGDNFTVTENGRIYYVESGGEATDPAIKQAATSVKNGQVFGYGEQLYVKSGGVVYKIQQRKNTFGPNHTFGYNGLYKKIYG